VSKGNKFGLEDVITGALSRNGMINESLTMLSREKNEAIYHGLKVHAWQLVEPNQD